MGDPFPPPAPTLPIGTVDGDATKKVSKAWWVLIVVLFLVGGGLAVGGLVRLVGDNLPDEAGTFDVPGRARIEITEPGTYRIRYQSDQYTETGVCRLDRREAGTGSERHTNTVTVCDPSLLALEGEPVVRPPGGGDRLDLGNGDAGQLQLGGEITLNVWTFEAEEAGTYTVRSQAPLGTQRLVVEPDEVGLQGLLFLAIGVPVLGLAIVLLVVTTVRSGSRKRRRNQAAYAAATAAAGPPTGMPAGSPTPD